MQSNKKYNSDRFRALITAKIEAKGYRSIKNFTDVNGFHRNPLARAVTGATRPSLASLNNWCRVLECTSQERKEIYHAVGYLSPDEMEGIAPLDLIA